MKTTIFTKPIRHIPIPNQLPVMKVVGLGGGGSNAINHMIELKVEGIQYIACDTDARTLKNSLAPVKIQLGPRLAHGQGPGAILKLAKKLQKKATAI